MGLIPGPLSHPKLRFKPRVIRKALSRQRGKDGRAKWAVDYKINARMERVKAKTDRPCADARCEFSPTTGLIRRNTEYAKVHANEGQGKFIKGRMIYSPRDYHFECVPEQYRPLIRFVKP